jgi:hypothetical protein
MAATIIRAVLRQLLACSALLALAGTLTPSRQPACQVRPVPPPGSTENNFRRLIRSSAG